MRSHVSYAGGGDAPPRTDPPPVLPVSAGAQLFAVLADIPGVTAPRAVYLDWLRRKADLCERIAAASATPWLAATPAAWALDARWVIAELTATRPAISGVRPARRPISPSVAVGVGAR